MTADRRRPGRYSRLALAWTLATMACASGPLPSLFAASPDRTVAWRVVETANFRIMNYGVRPVSPEIAAACESLRDSLTLRWLGATDHAAWNPKCDLVLHSTDEAYLREVGAGGRSTLASSLIDRQQGRVAARRIDVRATNADWATGALGHELTHVVLADHFSDRPVPRWIDEGTAILADTADKQNLHRRDLRHALAARSQFRVHELLTLTDYPAAHRWAAFYGQSASLVQNLIDRAGEQKLLEFVELSLEHGYEQGFQRVYGTTIVEFERRWQAELNGAKVVGSGPESDRAAGALKLVSLPASERVVTDLNN